MDVKRNGEVSRQANRWDEHQVLRRSGFFAMRVIFQRAIPPLQSCRGNFLSYSGEDSDDGEGHDFPRRGSPREPRLTRCRRIERDVGSSPAHFVDKQKLLVLLRRDGVG